MVLLSHCFGRLCEFRLDVDPLGRVRSTMPLAIHYTFSLVIVSALISNREREVHREVFHHQVPPLRDDRRFGSLSDFNGAQNCRIVGITEVSPCWTNPA